MQTELIIISEYCLQADIEPSFIALLEESGLIRIQEIENEHFLFHEELPEIEKYARWYYDLSINIEGIEAIRHLLDRVHALQYEIRELKNQIRLFQ